MKLGEHTHRGKREAGKAAQCTTLHGSDWVLFLRTLVFSQCSAQLQIQAALEEAGSRIFLWMCVQWKMTSAK